MDSAMEPGRYCEFGAIGEGRKVRDFSGSPFSNGFRNSGNSSSNGNGTLSMTTSLDMELESIISSIDLTSNLSSDSRRVSPWFNDRCFDLWGPYGKYVLPESSLSSFSPPSNHNFDAQYHEHRKSTSMSSYDPVIEIPTSNPRIEENELISECFNYRLLDKIEAERNISCASNVSYEDSSIWSPTPSITSSPPPSKQEILLESVWSSLVCQKSAIGNNVKSRAFDESSSGEASNSSPEIQEQNPGILKKMQNQLENFKPFFAEGSRVLNQAGYYHTGRKFEDLLEKTVELKDRIGSVEADVFHLTSSAQAQHNLRMNTYSNGNSQSTDSSGPLKKPRRRFPPSRQQKPAHRPKYNT